MPPRPTPRGRTAATAALVMLAGLGACSTGRAAPPPTAHGGQNSVPVSAPPASASTPAASGVAGTAVASDRLGTTTATAAATTTVTPSAPAGDTAVAAKATTTLAITTTTLPATTVAPVSAAAWQTFDELLAERLLGRGDFAGSVAVSVDGELVHTGAFGLRSPPAPGSAPPPGAEPAEATDRFRIASISKVITATVVLQLVEAGELQLDQPVGGTLATALGVAITDPAMATITVRQLLSHTSGLPAYQRTFFGGVTASCVQAAQRGLSRGLAAPPGTSFRYSNMNYCLLGLLVEQVSGQPYEAVAQERLLGPLGISAMRITGTFDPRPDEVQHPSIATRTYMETLGAAGAWVATAADVVTIANALDPATSGWQPLSDDTLALMREPVPGVVYPRMEQRWYGLGAIVFPDGSWGHTGTVENAHSMVLARPDGVTWAVLVNGEYPSDSADLRRIFDETIAAAGIALG